MKYNISDRMKKRLLLKRLRQQPEYRKNRSKAYLVYGIAISVFLGMPIGLQIFVMIYNKPMPYSYAILFLMLLFAASFIFASIPGVIGHSIKFLAYVDMAKPYSLREKGIVTIDQNGFEYRFHNVKSPYPKGIDVYRICKDNIQQVRYDKEYDIVYIIGAGELAIYENEKDKKYKVNQKFLENYEYSFIAATKDKDKLVRELKDMVRS